jgi:hypothetical protein
VYSSNVYCIREGDLLGPGPDKYLKNNHDISQESFTICF